MPPQAPSYLAVAFPAEAALPVLLAAVPTAALLLVPVTNAAAEIVDFAFAGLNPAARLVLGLGSQPIGTVQQLYPALLAGSTFGQCCAVLATGQPAQLAATLGYPAGRETTYQLGIQRVGQGLLLSLEAPAAAPIRALRESRQREQATRAEAERQRRQWEELFRRAPAAICIFSGPNWVYEFINSDYQALLPGRALLGRPLLEALPELRNQPLAAILRHVYDTGETYDGRAVPVAVAQVEGGPTALRYFDLTYQARYGDENRIEGLVTYAYEVTEQVLAHRARKQHETQLHRFYEQAPVAIAIFRGPQYVIELANPTVCALWGRSQRQALGTPLFELLPEAAGQGFEQLLDGVMATGQPYVARELPSLINRHGRQDTVYWNFVYQPLAEAGGRVTGVTVVATEVTEQVLARQQVQALNDELATRSEELATINEVLSTTNEELSLANRQLTRTNADLDVFLHTASHDLADPAATIESLLRAMRREYPQTAPSSQLPALLDLLHEATERLQHTVRQLTDVSRLQADPQLATVPLSLAQVLRQVLGELDAQLAQAGAKLELLVPELITVTLPEKDLRSILYNLLSNAIRFRRSEQPLLIRVTYLPQQDFQGFSVEDNGLGLDVRQTRQFILFYRQHPHIEGAGVGLYIVHKILENAGGRLEVQSQPGHGSTFSAYFPR